MKYFKIMQSKSDVQWMLVFPFLSVKGWIVRGNYCLCSEVKLLSIDVF